MNNYPYSDDYMIFNEQANRYVLTEKDVLENYGINLSARFVNPSLVKPTLNQVSLQVYSYIHGFNVNNKMQDYIIAHTEDGRRIIKEAMEQQLLYFLSVGDLSKTPDEHKRKFWFDEMAKEILMQPIKEIGTSILYTGVWNGLFRTFSD